MRRPKLLPGDRVQWAGYHDQHLCGNPVETGVLLDWSDPVTWAGTPRFPEAHPDPESVQEAVERERAAGRLKQFAPVRWDRNGLISTAPVDELQREGEPVPEVKSTARVAGCGKVKRKSPPKVHLSQSALNLGEGEWRSVRENLKEDD